MKTFYEVGYRFFRMPWEQGARAELVDLVESGRIQPCRAIDLGCGTGSNAIYLAQRGFDVTGVDYATAAIAKARRRADTAGASVSFVAADLTNLQDVSGVFDLLVDYGTFDDLTPAARELYLRSLLALSHLGSRYLLWCFEYRMRWWEYFIPFFPPPLAPDEAQQRFGAHFSIERIAGEQRSSGWPPGWAAYLMTRCV
jgi:cyclopropane fatty-acyl-phospholipid synthase-like methyltransferase